VLPALAARRAGGRAARSSHALARSKINRALDTSWLHGHGLALRDLRQDLLDAFMLEGASTRRWVGDFVEYLARTDVIDRLHVARPPLREPTIALDAQVRRDLISRLLADEQLDLHDRVAGLLVLLYAQPVARVAALRATDIQITDQRARFADDDAGVLGL
jgi:hypothetical protein